MTSRSYDAELVEFLKEDMTAHGFDVVVEKDPEFDDVVYFADAQGRQSVLHVVLSNPFSTQKRTSPVQGTYAVTDLEDGWSHAILTHVQYTPDLPRHSAREGADIVVERFLKTNGALDPTSGLTDESKVLSHPLSLKTYLACTQVDDATVAPSRDEAAESFHVSTQGRDIEITLGSGKVTVAGPDASVVVANRFRPDSPELQDAIRAAIVSVANPVQAPRP
jgi:hypothetical protein